MITLKLWNALSQESRSRICQIIGISGDVELPYHHNFDYDRLGKRVRNALECCNLQKNGTINVVVNIQPTMAPKQTAPSKKTEAKQQELKQWKFRRYTYDDPDDGEWVWAWGYTEDEARREIENEYWNTLRLECYGSI